MTARQKPEQQAPPVQRLRIRYAKRSRARFASHRDFARAFERALRRAGVPMAHSSGFTPHPRISYANAVPTGVATEAEYLEIGVRQRCDPLAVRQALDRALPDGLDILQVVEAPTGDPLADHLEASDWRLELVDLARLADAVPHLLAAESVTVERMTKNGHREIDVRAALLAAEVTRPAELELRVRHQVPQVRPEDLVRALDQVWSGMSGAEPASPIEMATVRVTRLAQGRLTAGGEPLEDPLAPHR